MSLNKSALTSALQSIFENPEGDPATAAAAMADAIDAYVKTGSVTPGTFSNSGGPVLGLGGIT